jgi:hypothetical protein
VGYEKINVVGKVLLNAGRAVILWTEKIKQKCFPVNGRAIDEKVLSLYEPSRCNSGQGKRNEFKAGTGWLNTYIRSHIHTYRHTHMCVHTYIGKVHPRTVHKGPEGGVDV